MKIKKYSVCYIILISIVNSAVQSQGIPDFEEFFRAKMQEERAVPSQSINRSAELTEPSAQNLEDFQNADDAPAAKKIESFEDFESFKDFEEFIDLSPAPGSDQSTSIVNLDDALALINQKVIENLKRNAAYSNLQKQGYLKFKKLKKCLYVKKQLILAAAR